MRGAAGTRQGSALQWTGYARRRKIDVGEPTRGPPHRETVRIGSVPIERVNQLDGNGIWKEFPEMTEMRADLRIGVFHLNEVADDPVAGESEIDLFAVLGAQVVQRDFLSPAVSLEMDLLLKGAGDDVLETHAGIARYLTAVGKVVFGSLEQ